MNVLIPSGEDTKMKFSVAPQPGESGFTQWLDAMKMVARLPGGIPPEFRKRVSLIISYHSNYFKEIKTLFKKHMFTLNVTLLSG